MKKYRLKKRNYINWIIVLIFIMIALIFVNIGYSLWSTRLNIFGNVTLDLNRPHLDVSVPAVQGGRYVNIEENAGFEFVKDEYSANSLVTTLRANGSDITANRLKVSFGMRNLSKTDDMYMEGTVKLIDYSNNNSAASNVSGYLARGIIESGESDIFNFSADIDTNMMDGSIYYKYEIIYSVNGIKKNFYYTINILPIEG
jgi:hypothetical protein